MYESKQEGIKIGEKRGIKIGEKRGIEIGEKRGIEIGEKRGIERICTLQSLLLQHGRIDDLNRSLMDSDYREKLFIEYGI